MIEGGIALEQIAPDWNREAIQGRVNLLGKTRPESRSRLTGIAKRSRGA